MAFTSEQEDELWELWGKGEPSRLIARSLRSNASAVNRHLAKHGGVRPVPRRRGREQLTIDEREEVTRGIAAGLSSRAIAALIGRAPSSVSREIARNGGRDSYRATVADAAARERARRPKMSRLASHPELLQVVRERLELDWSPEQIAHWLRREHPQDPRLRISRETIYRSIYVASRRELGRGPRSKPAARRLAIESVTRSRLISCSICFNAAMIVNSIDPIGVDVSTSPPPSFSTRRPEPRWRGSSAKASLFCVDRPRRSRVVRITSKRSQAQRQRRQEVGQSSSR